MKGEETPPARGDSAPWRPAGSPAQWQRPRMRGCVRTRDRITKPRWWWVRIGHAKRTPEFASWKILYKIYSKKIADAGCISPPPPPLLLSRAGIPFFLGLARKIIRARAIKNSRIFASKTRKPILNGAQSPRGLRKKNGGLLRKTPVSALRVPKILFSCSRAKIDSFSWLSADKPKTPKSPLCS